MYLCMVNYKYSNLMKTGKEKKIKVSAEIGATKSVEEITDSINEVKETDAKRGVTTTGIRFKKLKGIIFLL